MPLVRAASDGVWQRTELGSNLDAVSISEDKVAASELHKVESRNEACGAECRTCGGGWQPYAEMLSHDALRPKEAEQHPAWHASTSDAWWPRVP